MTPGDDMTLDHPNASIVPEGERRCVICGERMTQRVMEKVTMDVCEKHGVWLDREELPRIIDRIRMRSHDVRRQAMYRAHDEGVRQAFGNTPWWWFLV